MSIQMAHRVISGSHVITALVIAAAVLLAYWKLIDGAAAIATILAATGITSGTNAAVQANANDKPIPQATTRDQG